MNPAERLLENVVGIAVQRCTLPAGGHEHFFAEAGEPKANASAPFSTELPNIEKLVTVGKRHSFEILLPSVS